MKLTYLISILIFLQLIISHQAISLDPQFFNSNLYWYDKQNHQKSLFLYILKLPIFNWSHWTISNILFSLDYPQICEIFDFQSHYMNGFSLIKGRQDSQCSSPSNWFSCYLCKFNRLLSYLYLICLICYEWKITSCALSRILNHFYPFHSLKFHFIQQFFECFLGWLMGEFFIICQLIDWSRPYWRFTWTPWFSSCYLIV